MQEKGKSIGRRSCISYSLTVFTAVLMVVWLSTVAVVNANTETEAADVAERIGSATGTRMCVKADDTRSIELVRLQANTLAPCEVQQRRNNIRETLWRAENDGEFCSKAYVRYLERLSSLGFDCGLARPPSLDRASAGFE